MLYSASPAHDVSIGESDGPSSFVTAVAATLAGAASAQSLVDGPLLMDDFGLALGVVGTCKAAIVVTHTDL